PLLVTDPTLYETRYPQIVAEWRAYRVKTCCLLPLISAGRCLGALGFASLREMAWSEADQDFLHQVATLLPVPVDNAINFDEARLAQQQLALERDHVELLLEVNNAIVSHLALPELLKSISACLRRVLPHDFAGMALYDADRDQLRVQALDYARNQ